MNALLIKGVLALIVLTAAVAGFKAWEKRLYDQGFAAGTEAVTAKWNEANTKALREREAERARLQAQVDEALTERTKHEKQLRADAALVRAVRNGLRDELAASRAAITNASIETLRARIAALTDVFEQCTERYSDVAEKADRHAADALMFDRAWPKP